MPDEQVEWEDKDGHRWSFDKGYWPGHQWKRIWDPATPETPQPMTPERMFELSNLLSAEAEAMEQRIVGGTKEEWSALMNLRDASRALWSAWAWLTKDQVDHE